MSDKIAAIATGHARTGIGILRLSGDGCIEAAGQVFRLNSGRPLTSLPDRKLALGTLFDAQGRPIDHCMAFISRAPHSYTGEDTAEIQCHGSPAALTAGLEDMKVFYLCLNILKRNTTDSGYRVGEVHICHFLGNANRLKNLGSQMCIRDRLRKCYYNAQNRSHLPVEKYQNKRYPD